MEDWRFGGLERLGKVWKGLERLGGMEDWGKGKSGLENGCLGAGKLVSGQSRPARPRPRAGESTIFVKHSAAVQARALFLRPGGSRGLRNWILDGLEGGLDLQNWILDGLEGGLEGSGLV